MNPSGDQNPENTYHNPLHVMSPGEREIGEIKRHPFGMIGLYFGAALLIVILAVVAMLAPNYLPEMTNQTKGFIWFGVLVALAIILLVLYIGATIYNGNRWIISSDSITQVTQTGLFSKQTSQLSLANLEDVTYEQNSFVQQMFGFGLLKVETAGEHSKFSFQFCPKPAEWARSIIKLHEDFIQAHPEEGQLVPQGAYDPRYMEWLRNQPQAAPGQAAAIPPPSQPSTDDHGNNPTQG